MPDAAFRALACLFLAPGQAEPPPSPVIRTIEWAPAASVVRKAKDGDNWPLTWGGDDALYTTWGDGTGFDPKVEKKLSCGFARVTGGPEDFAGANVRSEAEQFGQGRAGLKAWGILSVDGVLWLWFGHADRKGGQSRLAWSRDRAKSWTFADWVFEDFGLMGFVNYGRDYEGARDGFVYAYSHDGPKADVPADRFVLLRASKGDLARRAAWEYWDGAGWTPDASRRAGVFSRPDGCLRSAMTYHAPTKRYLWWQALPRPKGHPDRGDTRFEGGFGVYDAPEPWGPWTTAFVTPRWDLGPGEHGDFPSKWMGADGRTLHLVFSGDDAFSVRRATLVLR
jgi:hypothetical protein